jgi:hypothetical protein
MKQLQKEYIGSVDIDLAAEIAANEQTEKWYTITWNPKLRIREEIGRSELEGKTFGEILLRVEMYRRYDDISNIQISSFSTPEEAAIAFDNTVDPPENLTWGSGDSSRLKNFSGAAQNIGLHVRDAVLPLLGGDGSSVLGFQKGVPTKIHVSLRITDPRCNYFEIFLDKAENLPKMDNGLGTCDPYCRIYLDQGTQHEYQFRSKICKNVLNPSFQQMFRVAIPHERLIATEPTQVLFCKIEVWDWDRRTEHDEIGMAEVDVMPFIYAAHRGSYRGTLGKNTTAKVSKQAHSGWNDYSGAWGQDYGLEHCLEFALMTPDGKERVVGPGGQTKLCMRFR